MKLQIGRNRTIAGLSGWCVWAVIFAWSLPCFGQTVGAPQQGTAQSTQQVGGQLAPQSTGANETPAESTFPPISLEEQQYIEQLLDYWEKSSGQIKHCACEFTRWDYDPQKVNWVDPRTGSLAAHTIMMGQIRYAAPDKAEYESNRAWDFGGPPDQPGGEPKLIERKQETEHEKWLCDGEATYDYDFVNKRLYETAIPESMRGNALANSPLPFLFGAKKDLILNRYYLRVITPQGAENEYWLEATPKFREDAQNYSRVQIVIAAEDFLPKSIHMFASNYDAKTNAVSRHMQFHNRKINAPFARLNQMLGGGIRPATPWGFERIDMSTQIDQGLHGNGQGQPANSQQPYGPQIK